MAHPDEFVLAPLGGVGEIGMNLAIYGLAQGAIARAGSRSISASPSATRSTCPASISIMPDIRYLEKERKNLVGIVLTARP